MKRQEEEEPKECPVARVAELLGDSCTILIVRDLLEEPKRFGELEERLPSSSRTLAKKLKSLESEGIVRRSESRAPSPCHKYRLTKKGAALGKIVGEMRRYGTRYL